MPNIFDLAKECGVSIATVSRALNGREEVAQDTRVAVLKAARRLGYRPHPTARGLKLKRTRTLGLMIASYHILGSPVPSEILRGLGETVEKSGYRLLVLSLGGAGMNHPSHALADHQVDGLFVLDTSLALVASVAAANLDLPTVLVNAVKDPLSGVSSANYEGARLGMRHLLELGHRRIGILRGPLGNLEADARWEAWRDSLLEAGQTPGEDWSEACEFSTYAELSTQAEEAAAGRLLERAPTLTALLTSSDLMALGAYRAAAARGLKVPTDLSVLAFDDTWAGRTCSPPLSILVQDPHRMGAEAAALLIRHLSGEGGSLTPASRSVIPVKLVPRASTAPPRTS